MCCVDNISRKKLPARQKNFNKPLDVGRRKGYDMTIK